MGDQYYLLYGLKNPKKNSEQELILRQGTNTGNLQWFQNQERSNYKVRIEHKKNKTDFSDLCVG